MRIIIKITALYIVLFSYAGLIAQDTTTNVLPSLKKVIEIGLENNYDLRTNKKIVNISKGEMRAYDGAFDFSLGADLNLLPGIQPTVESQDEYSLNLYLNKPTKIGVNLTTGISYLREINLQLDKSPSENVNGVWFQMDIPLLRGLGKYNVNFTNYKVSELQVKAKIINFDYETTLFIKNTILAYATVLNNTQISNNYKKSFVDISKFQDDLQLAADRGIIPKSELLINKAEMNQIESELKSAKDNLSSSYVNLMILLGEQTEVINIDSIHYDDSIPNILLDSLQLFVNTLVKNRDSIVRNNLNFIQQTVIQESASLQLNAAKNSILNDLDLQLKYNYYAMELNKPMSDYYVFNSSTYPGSSYMVSLNYTLPFGNNQARGSFIVKSEEFNMQQIITDQLLFEYKKAIENTAISLIAAYKIFVLNIDNLNIRKIIFNNEMLKYKTGNSDQFNLLKVRQDYIQTAIEVYDAEYAFIELLVNIKFLCNKIPRNTLELEIFNLYSLNP